jgi:hypothetical protein
LRQVLRSARLGLALVAFVGSVHAFAQFPAHYTVVDLGPVGPSSSNGQPFTLTGNGLISWESVVANPKNSGELVSQAVLWEGTNIKVISSPDSEGQTALPTV